MDESFEGDWPMLFGARTGRLRSVMLGDPQRRRLDRGAGGVRWGRPTGSPPSAAPANGFFLLSLFVDLDGARPPRRAEVPGCPPHRPGRGPGRTVPMATLRDPDGVLIELIGPPEPA